MSDDEQPVVLVCLPSPNEEIDGVPTFIWRLRLPNRRGNRELAASCFNLARRPGSSGLCYFRLCLGVVVDMVEERRQVEMRFIVRGHAGVTSSRQ